MNLRRFRQIAPCSEHSKLVANCDKCLLQEKRIKQGQSFPRTGKGFRRLLNLTVVPNWMGANSFLRESTTEEQPNRWGVNESELEKVTFLEYKWPCCHFLKSQKVTFQSPGWKYLSGCYLPPAMRSHWIRTEDKDRFPVWPSR